VIPKWKPTTTAVCRGQRYNAQTRWTPPLPLASAAPRRTPRRASSHLMISKWKPTTDDDDDDDDGGTETTL